MPDAFRVGGEPRRGSPRAGRTVLGTTVVGALETVAAPDGTLSEGQGWSSLVVTPERGLLAVDGLLTGWHDPESSHLQVLEAAAGADLLEDSYRAPSRTATVGTSSETST